MRQRNDTGYPLNSPDVGRAIGAGEEFSHPQHITGCTDLEQADGASADAAPPEDASTPARKRKTTTGSEGDQA